MELWFCCRLSCYLCFFLNNNDVIDYPTSNDDCCHWKVNPKRQTNYQHDGPTVKKENGFSGNIFRNDIQFRINQLFCYFCLKRLATIIMQELIFRMLLVACTLLYISHCVCWSVGLLHPAVFFLFAFLSSLKVDK